jgi:hypothetical protein
MNLIGFKRELEEAFYLRLQGSCGASQPQLSHPLATSTEGHRPKNNHQGFSPLHTANVQEDGKGVIRVGRCSDAAPLISLRRHVEGTA